MNGFQKGLGSAMLLVLAWAGTARAAGPSRVEVYAVRPESRAKFLVRSLSFFFPETVHGHGGLMGGEIRLGEGPVPSVSADLTISAATLKSGIGARDSKVRAVLRVKNYPDVFVRIKSVDSFKMAALDAGGVTVTARGALTVAGVTVPLAFPVFARRQGPRLFVSGLAATGFKDLKLDKPGMAFLVMVRDRILAGADIVAELEPRGSAAP